MDANELDKKVHEYLEHYDPYGALRYIPQIAEGQRLEVLNQLEYPSLYYQWLACLVRLVKPKQVVELGAAAGISTTLMAIEMPQGKLYSVDIDPKIAWSWMTTEFTNVVKILGDDTDLSIWPKEVDLNETDIWFIDTLHYGSQLKKEIETYKKFWKKGTIVVLDDINMNDMREVWDALPYDKLETSAPCHTTGFGFFIV